LTGNEGTHVSIAEAYTGRLFVFGSSAKACAGQIRIKHINFGGYSVSNSANTNAFLDFANCSNTEVSDCFFAQHGGSVISVGREKSGAAANITIRNNLISWSRGVHPAIVLQTPEGANAIWGASINANYFLTDRNDAPCIEIAGGNVRGVNILDNIFNKYGYYQGTGIVVRSGYSHNVSGNQFISFSTGSSPISFQPVESNDFRSTVANNSFGYSTPTNGIYLNANAHGVSVFGNSMPQAKIRFDGPNHGGYARDFSTIPTNGGPMIAASIQLGTNAAVSDWPAAPAAPAASVVVDADYVVQAGDYAVGADTAGGDVAVTLPDRDAIFSGVLVRKFSGANILTILRGTNVLETLEDDGATRAYDWWPDRGDWFARN
jgi:hypothetical protein